MTHGDVKEMILHAGSVQEADDILEKHTYCRSFGDKAAYLEQLFDIHGDGNVRSGAVPATGGVLMGRVRYMALLSRIVEGKGRKDGKDTDC